MPSVAICCICSRAKNENVALMPARQRYCGSHIAKVAEYAAQRELPFFILSGTYGLIPGEVLIPYYDHLLVAQEVTALMLKVHSQLRRLGLREIHFYSKVKPSWMPYQVALVLASESLGVHLHIHELSEDD